MANVATIALSTSRPLAWRTAGGLFAPDWPAGSASSPASTAATASCRGSSPIVRTSRPTSDT